MAFIPKLKPQKAVLDQLQPEPKMLWTYFLGVTEIPRPSGNLERIKAALVQFANEHRLDVKVDKVGNVRMRKPASPGCENAARVCLQSHQDMVPSKTEDKVHNFATDPIEPRVVGEHIKADRTTLGADDAVGVAACLAIMTDETLRHGPLEVLFTVDEETSMHGAANIDPAPFLQSSVMLNVDSECENEVCVGCAGGFEKEVHHTMAASPICVQLGDKDGDVAYHIRLHGLRGGHTGIDIHLGRANALILMARMMNHALETGVVPSIRLVSMSGGNAKNAIPRLCDAVVVVPRAFGDAFLQSIRAYFETVITSEFRGIENVGQGGMVLETHRVDSAAAMAKLGSEAKDEAHVYAYTADASRRSLDVMLALPHGVIRMSNEVKEDVETSISFSMTSLPRPTTLSGSHQYLLFARSSADSGMLEVDRRLDALVRLSGGHVHASPRLNFFPGWKPDVASAVTRLTIETHKEVFRVPPKRVYSVHAGLECGLFQGRYPGLKCVSIGPQVEGAHTPDEMLKISSFKPFYDWLRRVVERLADISEADATK